MGWRGGRKKGKDEFCCCVWMYTAVQFSMGEYIVHNPSPCDKVRFFQWDDMDDMDSKDSMRPAP